MRPLHFLAAIGSLLCFINLQPTVAKVPDTTGYYQPVLKLYSGNPEWLITQYYSYLEDHEGNMGVGDALKQYNARTFKHWQPDKVFNTGDSGMSAYWFGLAMRNIDSGKVDIYWAIANQVDSAILYSIDTLGKVIKKDTVRSFTPSENRVLNIRRISFLLSLDSSEERTYLMHVFYKSRKTWYLPMWFCSAKDMLTVELYRQMRLGAYIGIYLFVLCITVLFSALLRKPIYYWYTSHILSFLFFVLIDENMIIEYFNNEALIRYLYEVSSYPFIIFCLACNIKIMQLLCRLNRTTSKFHLVAQSVFILNVCFAVFGFISPLLRFLNDGSFYTTIDSGIDILVPISLAALFVSVFEQLIKKSRIALYYAAALLVFGFGLLNFYFNGLSLTNFVALKPNGLIVGTTVEFLILSFLIGRDHLLLRREKQHLLSEKKEIELNNSANIIVVQEAERNRIARDLHDDVGATLSTLQLHISQIPDNDAGPMVLQSYYKKAVALITKATHDLRSIAHDLVPLDFSHIGLSTVLQNRINEFNQKNITQFKYTAKGDLDKIDIQEKGIAVYRIVNELCTNINKHAQASVASIQMTVKGDILQTVVEDDGIGLENAVDKKGIGLKNITSRVNYLKGTLHMDTNSNGTTFIIEIPL